MKKVLIWGASVLVALTILGVVVGDQGDKQEPLAKAAVQQPQQSQAQIDNAVEDAVAQEREAQREADERLAEAERRADRAEQAQRQLKAERRAEAKAKREAKAAAAAAVPAGPAPDTVGMTLPVAKQTLKGAGFKVMVRDDGLFGVIVPEHWVVCVQDQVNERMVRIDVSKYEC